MKFNHEWHLKHKMPLKASFEQRLAWHIEHAKHCGCRKPPPKILDEMIKSGIQIERGQ
ncbi:MAG: hypothetical protein IT257_11450 [Chitinophagaceae bacterium]|nr:hypothetical protein [Chitinophagaceae bacterium]